MKELAQKLQPLFLARPRREKVLAAMFLVVLALIWTASVAGRANATSRELALLRGLADDQRAWLNNEATIETRYAEAMSRLSQIRLPTRQEVLAGLDDLARLHGVGRYDVSPPVSERREGLTFHTYLMTLRQVEYGQLQSFHDDLKSTLPSVNLSEVRIETNLNNRTQLTARLRLVAIELNR